MSIQLFDGAPFRILLGRERGWGSVSYLSKAIAQELGVENSEVFLTSFSTDDSGINVIQFGAPSTGGLLVRSTALGESSVQIGYVNSATGESGTAEFIIEVVDGTDPLSDKNYDDTIIRDAQNTYEGYDLFVTADELRSMYNDGTSETNNLEIKVTGGGFRQTDSDPNADIYLVEDGVWGIRQEDYESRPDQNTNRAFFFYTVTDPDTGVTFSDYAAYDVTAAPSGYTPQYTLDEGTNPIVSDAGINFYDQPTPSLIEAGVEGEDFIYDRFLNSDNNRLARRGLTDSGDFWVRVKNGSDELIGNGQEIALIAGSEEFFSNGPTAQDIITGLSEGELVATNSFASYDGVRSIASFEAGSLDGLAQSAAEQGYDVNIARIDAVTFEVLGNEVTADLTASYSNFEGNYNNSLSANNEFAYGDILAAQVDPLA